MAQRVSCSLPVQLHCNGSRVHHIAHIASSTKDRIENHSQARFLVENTLSDRIIEVGLTAAMWLVFHFQVLGRDSASSRSKAGKAKWGRRWSRSHQCAGGSLGLEAGGPPAGNGPRMQATPTRPNCGPKPPEWPKSVLRPKPPVHNNWSAGNTQPVRNGQMAFDCHTPLCLE